MTRSRRLSLRLTLRLALAVALLGLGGASLLSAEWLVTRDGQRLETRGPWEIRGKSVVFTLPNGTLGSMPLDDIDLEASRSLEESLRSKEAVHPEAQEKKVPVLVLTDADLPGRRPEPEAPAEEGSVADEEGAPAGSSSAVRIEHWERGGGSEGPGFAISGEVRNNGPYMALDLRVSISLFDEEGPSIAVQSARVGKGTLPPGESTTFKADFDPLVSDYARVEFEVSSFEATIKGSEAEGEQGW